MNKSRILREGRRIVPPLNDVYKTFFEKERSRKVVAEYERRREKEHKNKYTVPSCHTPYERWVLLVKRRATKVCADSGRSKRKKGENMKK